MVKDAAVAFVVVKIWTQSECLSVGEWLTKEGCIPAIVEYYLALRVSESSIPLP